MLVDYYYYYLALHFGFLCFRLTPTTATINTSECGSTKGCFFNNCEYPNSITCDYGLTWTDAGNGTAFELFARIPTSGGYNPAPWVAFGLSLETKMDSASVTDCIYDSTTSQVVIQMSWNFGHTNAVLNNKYLSLVTGSLSGNYSNGMLYCRFTRLTFDPLTSRSKRQTTDSVYYPGTQLFYSLIGKGGCVNGIKLQHPTTPVVSSSRINFTSYDQIIEQNSINPLIKAHGILMIFGWMVFASSGILMPRYFKTSWPGKTWCGKAIWFQIHQPFMVITFLLTATAFIIIWVKAGGYSSLISFPEVAHPPMGIVVMTLVFINPVMAAFRPAPEHKYRWIFNICHFAVGLLAHLCSVVTLFLAMYITEVGLPGWCKWVMVSYIWWHSIVEIVLAIRMHVVLRQKNTKKNELSVVQLVNINSFGSLPIKSEASDKDNDDVVDDNNGTVAAEAVLRTRNEEIKSSSSSSPPTADIDSIFPTVTSVLHLVGVLGCSIALSVQIGIS